MFQTIVVIAITGVCFGALPPAGHGGTAGEVDSAIENVELHYNDYLCLDLLMVDCANHVTVHDEQICATNGVTYPNHCSYVHKYCEFAHSHPQLGVASLGACPVTTTVPPATHKPIATTTARILKSTAPTTSNTNNHIVQSVFCTYAANISCVDTFDPSCGSDGHLYFNKCLFSKALCTNPTLQHADISSCPVPGK